MIAINKRWLAGFFIAFLVVALGVGASVLLPIGMPNAARYFDPVGERHLLNDEVGQINAVEESFYNLTLQGDDFKGWATEHRPFWKYSIAFAAYGIPSLIIIDPSNKDRYQAMMDAMIWKMKSKRVWSDFTERGFGSDPITVQNIMYKGHLNLMYGLYQLATNDQRYAREYTWLTQQLAAEMQLHHQGKYEGVTCEPGAWFVECNAIGMLSLHVYDRLYGTNYTQNEVRWSLDFILDRMRDPQSGLFYRAYLPNHDLVKDQISGYSNAWIVSFLKVFAEEQMAQSYPSFKHVFVEQFGPYAAVREHPSGEPDQIAQIFGLWAAKEHGDVELFSKLRNAVDKFGGLDRDASKKGLVYNDPNSVLINGVIVSSKVHLGWSTVLNYPWESIAGGAQPIPDVSGMDWTDLLPQHIYSMNDSVQVRLPAPDYRLARPCPSCYWGDYESVRMKAEKLVNSEQYPSCASQELASCNLDGMNRELIDLSNN